MKKFFTVNSILFALAVFFSFLPLYGISYILLLVLGIRSARFSKTFSSSFATAILCFLLLSATVMVVGLLTYLINLPLYPVLCVLTFSLLLVALSRNRNNGPRMSRARIETGDWVSLCLGLIAPVIVLLSFLVPHPSYAAIYQFLSTGWDNGSHINLLQNNSNARGYVYGQGHPGKPRDSVDRARSYPQGWHLATAHMADGFKLDPFDAHKPLRLMAYYLAIYLLWYVIAAFCVARVAWALLEKVAKNESKHHLKTLLFIICNLLIQSVTFYGALSYGFANYIGMLAYLALLIAMALEQTDTPQSGRLIRYGVALLAVAAITMTWLLPLPAVVLIVFLSFVVPVVKRKPRVASLLSPHAAIASALTLLFFALIAIQVYMYESFSQAQNGQINVGGSGTFSVSVLLFVIVMSIGTLFWLRIRPTNNAAISTLFPLLLLSFGIYTYQVISSGSTSYYFGKTVGLSLVAAGIFFAPAVTSLLLNARRTWKLSSVSTVVLMISVVATLTIGCEQSPQAAGLLIQSKSKVPYGTAQATVDYLRHSDPPHTELIVMRHIKRAEDDNGYMYNLLSNTDFTCANHVTGSSVLRIQLHSLAKCSRALPTSKLIVITSRVTDEKVKALNLPNVSTVKVP